MSTAVRPALASDAPSLALIRAATAESEAMVDEATRRSRVRSESYAELIEKHAGLAYVVETCASVAGFVVLQHETHHAVVGHNPLKLWQ